MNKQNTQQHIGDMLRAVEDAYVPSDVQLTLQAAKDRSFAVVADVVENVRTAPAKVAVTGVISAGGLLSQAGMAGAHEAPSTNTVVVELGDTLTEYEQKTGIAKEQIAEANGIIDLDRIFVGDTVTIPNAVKADAYVVRPGDTLDAIAMAHGTTTTGLLADSDNAKFRANPDFIQVGDRVDVVPESDVDAQVGSYRVAPGDSFWNVYTQLISSGTIAQNTPFSSFVSWNQHIANPDLIHPGVTLFYKQTTSPAPVATPEATPVAAAVETVNLPANKVFTAEVVQTMLPEAPTENIEKYLPVVLDALREQGIADEQMVLYALATISPETAAFEPILEYASGAAYEGRKDLGNVYRGDGVRFKGRGFIQLTGRANYRTYGERLGIDLEGNPDLALEPETAARILAVYLADRQEGIRDALNSGDMAQARRFVNGGINGLGKFTSAYVRGDELADMTIDVRLPDVPVETPVAVTPESLIDDTTKRTEAGGFETVEVQGIRVRVEIAEDVERMLQAAAADGVELRGYDGDGGFRTNQEQIELRAQNCGSSDYAIYETAPGNCSPATAIPGTSNHESGEAIDFANSNDHGDETYKWLADHAAEHGFHNLPSEPWHWSRDGK